VELSFSDTRKPRRLRRPPRPAARFGTKLAGIAVIGLAARTLLMMTLTRYRAPDFDAAYYDLTARAIAHGHWFVFPFGTRRAPTALFPPAYSVFLALFGPLGAQSRTWHLFIGCCLGAVSIVLVGYLARRFLSDGASLLVAGMAALYPPLVGSDASGMSEALFLPLILATLLLAMQCTSRKVWPWALMGVTIGLAALTRGEALIYLPLLVLPVALCSDGNARRKVAQVGLTTSIVIVVIAPWTIRNEATFGSPVLIANDSSTVIAGANCHLAYHGRNLGAWDHDCLNVNRPGAAQMNETLFNNKLRQEGISYINHHLSRVPLVAVVRLLRTYGLYAPTQQFRIEVLQGRVYQAEHVGWFIYLTLLPLAFVGARELMRRRTALDQQRLIALFAPLVAVTLVTILTYGNPRFRVTAEPTLLVLAVMGGTVLARRRSKGAIGAADASLRSKLPDLAGPERDVRLGAPTGFEPVSPP
jgi:4-amino-4-deoxy-L-arabinose transferase-like glycosyltransferase